MIPPSPGDDSFGNNFMSSMILLRGQRRSTETACDEVVGREGGEKESVVKRSVRTLFIIIIKLAFVQSVE